MLESAANTLAFRFGDFELIPAERFFRKNGENVRLPPRALEALILLVESQGKIVTKEDLIQRLWPESFVEENNLSQAISTLRKVLGTHEDGKSFIETVPKTGYRFAAQVTAVSAESEQIAAMDPQIRTSRRKFGSSWTLVFAAIVLLLLVVAAIIGVSRYRTVMSDPGSAKDAPKRLTSNIENEQVAGWTNDGRILFTRRTAQNIPETLVISPDGGDAVKATNLQDVSRFVPSADGSKIVFWKYSDNGAAAYLSNADGTAAAKLPFAPENIAWAPDGSKFAFQASALGEKKLASTEVLVFGLKDQQVTEITSNAAFDGDPGWSPDGGTIVFASDRDGNYEIYSMKADGSEVRRLTNNPGHDSFPKFSPDGTLISFNSNFEAETTDIYLIRTDGSGLIRLVSSKGNDLSRNGWSPDGTKFAYNSDVEGNDDIFVIDVDPFRPALVLEMPNAELQTPAYSPDGRKIVFTAEFPDKHSELRVFDKASGRSDVIVKTSSPKNYPQWSPDGNWIAFGQEVNGRWDVFKVRPDGSELTNLTNDPASDSVPVWSPDSAAIYFRSNRNAESDTAEIFKMNADGSNLTLLPIRKGKVGWPTMSLKGNELVFAADRETNALSKFDIYAMDLATGVERCVVSRLDNDTQPSVSPDGKRVAFVSIGDGDSEIYIVNADGTMPLRLTRNSAKDLFPSLSADASAVLFTSNRSGRSAIYEITLN